MWCVSSTFDPIESIISARTTRVDNSNMGMYFRLSDAYEKNVRPYIDIVDCLRSSGLDQDVSLPSVVVIGDQSTGKSSVLEAISGVQLPRGTGIVTRCALELRMKKMRGRDADGQWKGRLRYIAPGEDPQLRNLESPEEVEEAVREAQEAVAGEGKGVSEEGRIELEVYSPNVPDLTLIDLPGITRIAAMGQPADVGEQIKRLIKKHIVKGETIILCVIPCTSDITTTEALALAQEVDPEGARTLGVLTRADQTGQGEEKTIIDIVRQRGDMLLKLDCTVVKCRSQRDIENSMSLEDALDAEKAFFRNHEVFCDLEQSTVGIEQLALKLTKQLVDHIRACFPNLLTDVEKVLKETNEGLKQLATPIPKDRTSVYLVEVLQCYGRTLNDAAKGEYMNDDGNLFNEARSCFDTFGQSILDLCPNDADLEAIECSLREQRGRTLPGFQNYAAFERLARTTVRKFEQPALDCLHEVKQIVRNLYTDSAADQLKRFPILKEKVIQHVESLFRKSCDTAEEAIRTLMRMEEWIFTRDPVYQSIRYGVQKGTDTAKASTTVNQAVQNILKSEITDPINDIAKWTAKEILEHLRGYFQVVCLRLGDHIPMAIMLHLSTDFVAAVEKGLIMKFVGQGKTWSNDSATDASRDETDDGEEDEVLTAEVLLTEDREISFQRQNLEKKKQRLMDAERRLQKFSIRRKKDRPA